MLGCGTVHDRVASGVGRTLLRPRAMAPPNFTMPPAPLRKPPADASCPNAAWVTLISGEQFVPLALCLHERLVRLGSVCPLLIVYDDMRKHRALSRSTLARLATNSSVAAALVPLSSLIRRAMSDPSMVWRGGASLGTSAQETASASAGEKSYAHQRVGRDIRIGSSRYWMWAFDPARYERLVYLDVDLLLLRNVDELLFHPFSTPIAAVTTAPLCKVGTAFNGGVFIFRPSIQRAVMLLAADRLAQWPFRGRIPKFKCVRLVARGSRRHKGGGGGAAEEGGPVFLVTRRDNASGVAGRFVEEPGWAELCAPSPVGGCSQLACLPASHPLRRFDSAKDALDACRRSLGATWSGYSIRKACEAHLYDQSVLNAAFHHNWTPLPRAYNVPQQAEATAAASPGGVAILHFQGAQKPYERFASCEAAVRWRTKAGKRRSRGDLI